MAVKIRLKRMGKKRQPSYRVVVADGRSPRDGRFIEQIGRYEPLIEPSLVEIDNDRAVDWLSKGAQPTDAVRKLLEISGAWGRFKAAKGEIYTIRETTAPKVKRSKKQVAAEAAEAAAGPAPAEDVATATAASAAPAEAAAPDDGGTEAAAVVTAEEGEES